MPMNFEPQSALHVALIPDGNGRWAVARGLPRSAGHRAGVGAVRRAVRAASRLGIGTLTVHALSCDNWKRPDAEVRSILGLVAEFLLAERERCRRKGVRVTVIGRRDRLPADLRVAIQDTERATARGRRLHVRLAVDYSSRDAIFDAVATLTAGRLAPVPRSGVDALLGIDGPRRSPVPPVDLLVRWGGEQRVGDFLLWEAAYAEILFLDRPWPEFRGRDLAAAVAEFRRRDRRFGGLPDAAAPEREPAEVVR